MLIPGFKILEELQVNTGSLVLRAERVPTGEKVIIKTLAGDYPDLTSMARIRHEYSLARETEHPGIVRPLELISFNDRIAIIYEDFGGIPLDRYLREKPDLLTRLRIAVRLSDILGHIHNENIIHKDLKPGNIIINPENGDVRITDFGISTRLEKETLENASTSHIEGSLPYISPEQSGRMNRSLDYRTDIYSLGVSLYEIFTGKLPYYGADAIELIYGHIAKNPPRPSVVNPSVPEVLGDIILRCMAKKAEERYQSAFGLKKDLQYCLSSLKKDGEIRSFRLARYDISSKFRLSQTLYGREQNISELVEGLNLVQKRSALMLVSGYSGIGKSSAINELQRPVAEKRGWLLKGKFDQFRRNIPYAALIQAFGEMISQILAEHDPVVERWKQNIIAAVGDYGKLLTGVIPDLELITGPFRKVPELDPDDEIARFYQVFKQFIRVFAETERPLTICLDDLQWADTGTLDLIKKMIVDQEVKSLLIICTYRSNEVDSLHPLTKMISACVTEGGVVRETELKPLSPEHNLQLIADSLLCSHEEALTLAKLVYSKTRGNPFFTGQLLRNIYDEGLLKFNLTEGRWEWNIEEIRGKNISDNVISLMEEKLNKLPEECLYILQLGSCLGASFSLEIIALVVEKPRSYILSTLIYAIHEGIILSPGFDYKSVVERERQGVSDDLFGEQHYLKFVHDRIQQAAYQPIEKEKKKEYRLRIGRLLLRRYLKSPEHITENSFEIVSHLNEGLSLVTEEKELVLISTLNLKAGIRAKEAAAFRHSLEFLGKGIEALGPRLWKPEFLELSYQLNYHIAEACYLNRDHESLEKLAVKILGNLKNPVWKAQVYLLMMNLRLYQGRIEDAFNVGMRSLSFLGIHIPRGKGIYLKLAKELVMARLHSAVIRPDAIEDITLSKNPETALKAKVLAETFAVAQDIDQNITGFLTLKLFNLSFEEGFTEYSVLGYLASGHILKVAFGDWEVASRMADVGCRLMEKFKFVRPRSQFYGIYAFTIALWYKPPEKCNAYLDKALFAAQELGNGMWAAFCSSMKMMHLHACDTPLSEHLRVTEEAGLLATRADIAESLVSYRSHLEFLSVMMSKQMPTPFLVPSDYQPWGRQTTVYVQNKLKQLYLLGEYDNAFNVFFNNREFLNVNPVYFPCIPVVEFYFYLALVLIQVKVSGSKRWLQKKWLRKSRNYIFKWSVLSPDLCRGRRYLIKAEELSKKGRYLEAVRECDLAIDWALESGLIVISGLANECAAKALLNMLKPKLARAYILEARFMFEKWGATAKVATIDRVYRELLLQVRLLNQSVDSLSKKSESISSTRLTGHSFDIDTVIKFSRAVASEIRIGDLLKKIMRFILENAGAQQGFLILKKSEKSDDLFIEASGHADRENLLVMESVPLASSRELSISVVQYVYRTQKTLVLDDASSASQFQNDPYISQQKPGSVLCAPIQHQGKLLGILYLENNLVSDAFVGERMKILDVLVTQTAVSIENALLYAHMEEKVRLRTRQLQEKSREMADILGSIEQVIFTFNRDLNLNQGHSARTEEYFPEFKGEVAGIPVGQILKLSEEKSGQMATWLKLFSRSDAVRKWGKYKLLCPLTTLTVNQGGDERVLEFDFQPVLDNEEITSIMALGSDITEKKTIERQLQETRRSHELQMERVMTLVWQDREVVIDFVGECRDKMKKYARMVDVKNLAQLLDEAFREVHTLKGNAGTFGLNHLASLLEKAEDFLTKLRHEDGSTDIASYFLTWSGATGDILDETEKIFEVRDLVFGSDINYISVPKSRYDQHLKDLMAIKDRKGTDLLNSFLLLNSFPLKELMRKYTNLVHDSRKFRVPSGIRLTVLNPDMMMPKLQFSLFDTALVHLIRNALAHGFGRSLPAGKFDREPGEITVSFSESSGVTSLEVADNGAGIDPDQIWRHALRMGLISREKSCTDREKVSLIFIPGFSTREKTDKLSGRGVGMDVVKKHLESLGGGVEIDSAPGKGTRVRIWIPADAYLKYWYPGLFGTGRSDIA